MSTLTRAKLALALIGLVLFGYGARVDDTRLRWFGIGFLAAAVLLRFWPKGPAQPPSAPPPE